MAFERLEGGRDILASSDLGCDDFEPEWPAVVWTSAISSICKYDRNNRCGLLAAITGPAECVTMTSTLRRTNSSAISAIRSLRPSAQLYPAAPVRPSIQPSSRSPCTRAATQLVMAAAELAPMR